jgi:hypothetical protein
MGEARRRGTFAERKAAAIDAGRDKEVIHACREAVRQAKREAKHGILITAREVQDGKDVSD